MEKNSVEWKANWIWNDGEKSPRNEWWCFRKEFTIVQGDWNQACISITADSRYLLYINGERVGTGPVRSWPFRQAYDTYEISRWLNPDRVNTIAVIVMHFGLSTYSYIRGRGGLLAQICINSSLEQREDEVILKTDDSWSVARHPGQDSRVARLSFQQAFAERIDARAFDEEWLLSGYDDSNWQCAREIGPAGMEPWTELVARDIPHLAEREVQPVRIQSLQEVTPVVWTTVIDTRCQMIPGSESHANAYGYAGYIGVTIRSAEPGTARIGITYRPPHLQALLFNGVRYSKEQFAGGVLEVELSQGDNLLLIELIGHDHGRGLFLALDTVVGFELVSPLQDVEEDSSPFISIGPYHAYEYIDHDYHELAQRKHKAVLACGKQEEPSPEFDDQEVSQINVFQEIGKIGVPAKLSAYSGLIRSVPQSFVSKEAIISLMSWKRQSIAYSVPARMQNTLVTPGVSLDIPMYKGADTELVIDFGTEMTGYLSFDVEASEGTVLDLYGFEYMDGDWIQHMHYVENSMRYICREGRQQYLSPVRRGFRYVMITVRNATQPVRFYNFNTLLSHYPAPETGQFQCSDSLLNEIWKISRHTLKICMEDTFVDCPAFEQTFWVGDSRNEALIAYYVFGSEPLVKRCLNLVPGSSVQTPLYADQVPSGFNSVIPNWTFFWIRACLEYYHRTEDHQFVTDIWPNVDFTLQHYLELLDERGLLFMHGWNFLDWAAMDQPRHGVVTPQNMFLVQALRAAADLAEVIGQHQQSVKYRIASESLCDSINRELWSAEQQAYLDCIHADGRRSEIFSMQTQVVALICGIAKGEQQSKLESYLQAPPVSFVPIGSPFMSFFYYEALSRTEQIETILEDIRKQYGAMVEHGATTCWEMYPKPDREGRLPKQLTRSHCHAWSAAPPYFLGLHVLGVKSASPGWRKIMVQPQPGDLTWAKGAVPLPDSGVVEVSWELTGEKTMKLEVSAPARVEVEVILPKGYSGVIDRKVKG